MRLLRIKCGAGEDLISMKYINIFQYILCCSRAVFYMLSGVLVGNCAADAAFALFAPNVYSASACFVPNEKCDIYSKAEENALREKQKVCILERHSSNIPFPQNHRICGYNSAVNKDMHYSVVVKQIAGWTRCVSDEFAISVQYASWQKLMQSAQ